MADSQRTPGSWQTQDLTGEVFGRLTVLGRNWDVPRRGNRVWLCRCECGREHSAITANLRSGSTKSCGCLAIEVLRGRSVTHGMSASPEWLAWKNMQVRCCNPKDPEWHRYGGRGIKVCARWVASFEDFLADVGPRPSPKHSLDRFPNRDGNYEPGNCRWATSRQQACNKCNNLYLTFRGETLLLVEWAERTGMQPGTLYARVYRYGWPVERSLTTPPRPRSDHA